MLWFVVVAVVVICFLDCVGVCGLLLFRVWNDSFPWTLVGVEVLAMPKSSHLPRFPGGKKILYCAICSVPPEYCQYMDTPAECEEWLQNKHPDFYDELKQRTQKLEDERTAQIAAMEAEKEEEAMAAAMEAEMAEGGDAEEAAMLAAMEDEMAGEGKGADEGESEGGGAAAADTEGAKSDGGADEDDEGAKEKKKKRKTRRGGANNRRQTGKSAGPSVRSVCWRSRAIC